MGAVPVAAVSGAGAAAAEGAATASNSLYLGLAAVSTGALKPALDRELSRFGEGERGGGDGLRLQMFGMGKSPRRELWGRRL